MSPSPTSLLKTRYVPPETAIAAAKLSTQAIAILVSCLLLGTILSLLVCWCCCQRRIWRHRARRIARQKQKEMDMEAYSSFSSKPYTSLSKPYTSHLYTPPVRPQPRARLMDPGSWGNIFRREEKRGGPLNMVLNPRINRGNAKFYAPGLNREVKRDLMGEARRENERVARRDEEGRIMSRYEAWKADEGRTRPIEKPKRVFFGGEW